MKLQPEGQAVLAEIRRTGVDQIICVGDVATLGPQPNSVIEILGELDCPCILGNHDEFLLYPELAHSYSESPQVLASIEWSRGCLSADELNFIRSFRRHHEVPLGGDATLQLFHGTPRSNMEDVLATTPSDALDEMLGGMAATVMAGGHTHIQMLRQHHGNLLVNPGSVGLPFKDYVGGRTPTVLPHAEYALIEVSGGSVEVDLRCVPLDKGLLRVVQIDHRLRSWLLEQYL